MNRSETSTSPNINRTKMLAGSAIFGSLSFLMQIFFRFPYPLLPWLSFDLAEIPIILSLLVFGPAAGFISAIILFLILQLQGGPFPPGPSMKFLAVVSTVFGLWLSIRISSKLSGKKKLRNVLVFGLCIGMIFRTIVMTPINYLIVGVLFASEWYFIAAETALRGILGINFTSNYDFIVLMLSFTAIYNILHVMISIGPAYFIMRIKAIRIHSWINQTTRMDS